jgi:hypothetical protein
MWALWLVNIGTFFKHNVVRLVGIIVVGALLIGVPMAFYKTAYSKGYSQAMKDHPTTVITGGTTNIQNNAMEKESFAMIKLWFLKLHTTF